MNEKDIQRFWNKVNKDGGIPSHMPHLGKCWEWTGYKSNGYGSIQLGGMKSFAHRLSYRLVKGTIPDGLEICHACDNKGCVNPSHIWADIHANNMNDLKIKGLHRPVRGANHGLKKHPERAPMGERNCKARLTEKQVIDIRQQRQEGVSRVILSKKYGVDVETIYRIASRLSWRHVP